MSIPVKLKAEVLNIVIKYGGGIKFPDLLGELLRENSELFYHMEDKDIIQGVFDAISTEEFLGVLEYCSHVGLKYKKYFIYIKR